MIKIYYKLITVFFLCIAFSLSAQKAYNENFYKGGKDGLLKDMVKIAKKLNLQPCDDVDRVIIDVLVKPNATISYVKHEDISDYEKNKCAYDFGKKIMPYLNGWIPAIFNDESDYSVARVVIDPFVISNSKDDPKDNVIQQGGLVHVDKTMNRLPGILLRNSEVQGASLIFKVGTNGEILDIEFLGNFSEDEKRIITGKIKKLNLIFKPYIFNDKARIYKYGFIFPKEF